MRENKEIKNAWSESATPEESGRQEQLRELRAELEQIAKSPQSNVMAVLRSRLNSPDEVEEVKAMVFLRASRAIDRFNKLDPPVPLENWLSRIALRTLRNFVRDKKVNTLDSARVRLDVSGASVKDSNPNPEQRLLDTERKAFLREAVEKLSRQQKTAILLRLEEELPYEEIAKRMEISVPAVKSILFLATRNLQKKIEARLNRKNLSALLREEPQSFISNKKFWHFEISSGKF